MTCQLYRLLTWLRDRLCLMQMRLERYADTQHQPRRDCPLAVVKDAVIQAAIDWEAARTNVVICDWDEDTTEWEELERQAQEKLLDAIADLQQAMIDAEGA